MSLKLCRVKIPLAGPAGSQREREEIWGKEAREGHHNEVSIATLIIPHQILIQIPELKSFLGPHCWNEMVARNPLEINVTIVQDHKMLQ